LARNFWTLFAARVGVGVGEAALSPAAFSMISDSFPPERRAKPMSVFTMGIYIGAGLAFILGGAVVRLVSQMPPTGLPLAGVLEPWQMVFLLVSLPGFAIALLLSAIREPARQHHAIAGSRARHASVGELITFMRSHWQSLTAIIGGYTLVATIAFGGTAWTPTFLIRVHGYTAAEAGYAYGLLMLIFGTSGVLAGGALADRLQARGHADAPLRTMLGGALALVAPAIFFPLMPTDRLALALLAPTLFLVSFPAGVAVAALQSFSPDTMRAQITAVFLFAVSFLSLGLGPTLVALATDFVFGDDMKVGWSLALAASIAGPLAALILTWGLAPYRHSLARVQASVAA
ncbi:MAG: MFS transporter, partial [Alphaproteobacteria bacterium]